jgi:hypothetical protein
LLRRKKYVSQRKSFLVGRNRTHQKIFVEFSLPKSFIRFSQLKSFVRCSHLNSFVRYSHLNSFLRHSQVMSFVGCSQMISFLWWGFQWISGLCYAQLMLLARELYPILCKCLSLWYRKTITLGVFMFFWCILPALFNDYTRSILFTVGRFIADSRYKIYTSINWITNFKYFPKKRL